MNRTTPFYLMVGDITVRENADPYFVFLYARVLAEALFTTFNSNPQHHAILDAQPPDYSESFVLAWDGGQEALDLPVRLVLMGLHSKELLEAVYQEFTDGMPLHALVQYASDRIQATELYQELSALAREPRLNPAMAKAFVQKYAKGAKL